MLNIFNKIPEAQKMLLSKIGILIQHRQQIRTVFKKKISKKILSNIQFKFKKKLNLFNFFNKSPATQKMLLNK